MHKSNYLSFLWNMLVEVQEHHKIGESSALSLYYSALAQK